MIILVYHKLRNLSMERVSGMAKTLQELVDSQKKLCFSGAGVSTESGIPISAVDGLYSQSTHSRRSNHRHSF